jgi:glycosyltransferase involved in cell wall biosynthesis
VSEPVRVLRVIARMNMGGPALHVSYLTRGLAGRGYATTLATGEVSRGEDSMAYVTDELGVELLRIPKLHREISAVRDPVSIAHLVEVIRRVRPHILHTHTAKAGTVGRIAALLARDARPPVIVHTFHGHVLRGYFDPLRTEVFRETERRLAKHTSRLIAVSPEVRDDLVALDVAPAEKFSVIRLGLDLDARIEDGRTRAEMRRLFGVPDDRVVIGWIGRMTAIKRVEDVIGAFAELRRRGSEATLCLVGDGPDREPAERRAHELGVARDCLFLGYQRDVAAFYALIDLLLLTSANEGTPVVAIEALAAGRPVVSTRVGGVPDVVSDGVDGLLCDPGDVPGIATALEALVGDEALRTSFGRAGRERVLPRYRVERLVDDVDELYRSLLSERSLPQPSSRTR